MIIVPDAIRGHDRLHALHAAAGRTAIHVDRLASVQNEAVCLVHRAQRDVDLRKEALSRGGNRRGPGPRRTRLEGFSYLGNADVPPPFDLEEAVRVGRVGVHVTEPGGDSSFQVADALLEPGTRERLAAHTRPQPSFLTVRRLLQILNCPQFSRFFAPRKREVIPCVPALLLTVAEY